MKASRFLMHILLAILAVVFFFPVVITFSSSLMTEPEITSLFSGNHTAIRVIPMRVSLEQYVRLLLETGDYLGMFWNSVMLSCIITMGAIMLSLVAAFFFAKARFPGRDLLFFLYIIVMMLPFQVTLLPNYMFMKWIGLYDTRWALILPAWFAPFGVFLLRQFIIGLPNETMEAAALETNSALKILIHVVAPAARSGVMALMLLTFADSWNMVEQPLILLENAAKYPLSLVLGSLQDADITIVFAGSMIYMMPMIILYAAFHEQLVEGVGKAHI